MSGFSALRSTLRRSQTEYPSVTSVLLRSMLTGAVHNQERSLRDGVVDLMVKMHLPGVGLLEFERVREVAAFGYDDSVEKISEWAARATVDRGAGVILLTLRDLRFRAVRFVVVVLLGAVVFALLFVMTGLVEQFNIEPYDTVDAFGASTWVLPEGVSGPFTASSTMPADTVDAVVADVDRARRDGPVEHHDRVVPATRSILVGHDVGRHREPSDGRRSCRGGQRRGRRRRVDGRRRRRLGEHRR